MDNENNERTERVYQRTVTISFDAEQPDRDERRERSSLIMQSLANRGIRLMDNDWSTKEPSNDGYGQTTVVKTTTVKTLRFGKANIVIPSSVTAGELSSITAQLDEQYATVTVDEAVTTEQQKVWQIRGSQRVWVNAPQLLVDANAVNESGLNAAIPNSEVTATVKVSVGQFDGTFSMVVCLQWETDSVKRSADIKHALTDVPEDFVALLQAHFTASLAAAGVSVGEPTFDCEFTANIETVSKCEPDIIKSMEKARQARL